MANPINTTYSILKNHFKINLVESSHKHGNKGNKLPLRSLNLSYLLFLNQIIKKEEEEPK